MKRNNHLGDLDLVIHFIPFTIYLTGFIFIKIFTLGKVRVAPYDTMNQKLAKSKRRGQTNGLWIRHYGKKCLHAGNTVGVGMAVWVVVIFVLIILIETNLI